MSNPWNITKEDAGGLSPNKWDRLKQLGSVWEEESRGCMSNEQPPVEQAMGSS